MRIRKSWAKMYPLPLLPTVDSIQLLKSHKSSVILLTKLVYHLSLHHFSSDPLLLWEKESSKGFKMKMMILKAVLSMLEVIGYRDSDKPIALIMMVKMKSVILTLLLIF